MSIPPHLLDELGRSSLAEFVRTRDRLAAELRRNGEPYAAMELKALRKPTAVVWAINQLARRERPRLDRALQSAEALRAAQLGRVGGGARTVKRSTDEYHAAVTDLVERVDAILEAAQATTMTERRALRGRIEATILAALARAATREALSRGHLTTELVPPGFEGLEAPSESTGRGSRRRRPRQSRGVERSERGLRLVRSGEPIDAPSERRLGTTQVDRAPDH